MARIHERPLTCPVCETAFDGHVVLASPSRGPTTSDLRRLAEGEDPLPYQLNACPNCGYTGEAPAFAEHAPNPEQRVPGSRAAAYFDADGYDDAHDPTIADGPGPSTLKALIEAHLAPRATAATEDAAKRWEHHAQVVRWAGEGPLREADAWLRAAWMHDDAGRADEATRTRTLAIRAYRQGVQEKRWFARREDLVVVAYLLGELHRRLGDGEEAGKWFDQARSWGEGHPGLTDLLALAERQATDPRELV
jgi:hypothetical protein